MKYHFNPGSIMKPLLVPFGATRKKRFVDLGEHSLHIKLGGLFDQKVDLAGISAVEETDWPLIWGLGVRIAPGKKLGVVVSTKGVVRLTFEEPRAIPVFFGITRKTRYLYLSLQKPRRFIEELRDRLEAL